LFTTTELLAASSSVLSANGYHAVPQSLLERDGQDYRAFEDPYAVVSLFVFETWEDLTAGWREAQGAVVELLSRHFERDEPKAWEGYLVLLTADIVPTSRSAEVAEIRSDTTYVRKLVLTGNEIRSIADIEGELRPVLPLHSEPSVQELASAVELLPSVMSRHGAPGGAVRVAVASFMSQEPLAESLHRWLEAQRET
jgi:hypothetical protein